MTDYEILLGLEQIGLVAVLLYAWMQERKERQTRDKEWFALLRELFKQRQDTPPSDQ